MRILIISTYYPFPPSIGGIETIVRNVALELSRRGHNVSIACSTYDPVTQRSVADTGTDVINNVRIHKLNSIRLGVGYARILKNIEQIISIEKPQIIHLHNIHPPIFQVLRLKDKYNFKIVIEPHHPAVELEYFSSKVFFPIAIWFLKFFRKRLDAILTHTEIEYRWFLSKGFDNNILYKILFPGVDKELLKATYNFDDKSNTIAYIGRIIPRKGLHILVDALKIVKDHRIVFNLILAGSRDDEYFKVLERKILENKLEDIVVYKGVVSEEEKIDIISRSKVVVLPSLKDYTPNIILEAQALGTPVIASNVGAISELVRPGDTGILVRPGDVEELARALISLLSNDELLKRMSYNAREFARNHTIDRKVDELEKLYEELINDRI